VPTAYAFATNAAEDGYISEGEAPDKTTLNPLVGQKAGSKYQTFLEFQVAALTQPLGSLGERRLTLPMGADYSTTDFTLEFYEYDWGGTLESEDFRSDAELAALYAAGKLIGSTSSAGWTANTRREVTLTAYGESRLADLFNAGGTLRLVIASDRQRQGIVASGNEYVRVTTASQADPYKPYISRAYENAAAGVILQFDMANYGCGSVATGALTFSRTSTLIKHGNFGASEQGWYFEVVAKNADSVDRVVSLWDATNSAVMATVTIPAGARSARVRSNAFTPNGGDVVYQLRNPQTTSENQVITWASRLIWRAKGVTKCDVPLGMIGAYAWPYSAQYRGDDSTGSAVAFSTTSQTYDTASVVRRTGPRLRKSHYRTPKSCRLDVVMCTTAGGTAKARLYDQDAAAQVGSLELSTTNDAAPYAVASGALDWADIPSDHHISVQLKNDTAGKTTYYFKGQLTVHLAPVQEADAIVEAIVGWGGVSSGYTHEWSKSLLELDAYGGNIVGLGVIGYASSRTYGNGAQVSPYEYIGQQTAGDDGLASMSALPNFLTVIPATGWSYDFEDADLAYLANNVRVVASSKATGGSDGWTANAWWIVNYGNPGIEWTGLSLSINGGVATTDDNDVALTINARANGSPPDEMRFSSDGVVWTDWQAYATGRAWQLPAQTDADPHACTVYAQFRAQLEGEWYESEAVSDSIDLEVAWTESIALNAGAETTYGTTVDVTLAATSSAGAVTHYRLREDAGTWSPWTAYAPTTTLELDGLGEHTVDAQFRDNDSNTSPGTSAAIEVLDTGEAAEILAVEPVQRIVAGILGYLDGELVAEFRAVGGSITADARNAIMRTCSIDFAPGIWSGGEVITGLATHRAVYELLCTPGLELAVRRGWRTPQGDDVIISLGRFIVDEATYSEAEDGTRVSCSGSDLAARIQRAHWTDPYQIASGTQLAVALDALLRDRWPDVRIGFDEVSVPDTLGAAAVFEAGADSDPWADAQNLAEAHGYVLYPDTEGVFRLRMPPDPSASVPLWTFERGDGAVIVQQERVAPMERVYNGVIVTGEGSGLDVPVRGEAWDEQPDSPTSIYGPYGLVPYFYSSSLIADAEQAASAAESILATVIGRIEQLSWQQIPNPSLAPLDPVEIEDEDEVLHSYIIDEITIPLSPTQAMSATARETRIAYGVDVRNQEEGS